MSENDYNLLFVYDNIQKFVPNSRYKTFGHKHFFLMRYSLINNFNKAMRYKIPGEIHQVSPDVYKTIKSQYEDSGLTETKIDILGEQVSWFINKN